MRIKRLLRLFWDEHLGFACLVNENVLFVMFCNKKAAEKGGGIQFQHHSRDRDSRASMITSHLRAEQCRNKQEADQSGIAYGLKPTNQRAEWAVSLLPVGPL